MKKLLFFIPLQLLAMEQQDIILYVEPERTGLITNDDIKRWATMELEARDVVFQAKLKALEDRLEEHTKDNGTAHTKTRAALIVTAITSICGVVTTLITYFTTRYCALVNLPLLHTSL